MSPSRGEAAPVPAPDRDPSRAHWMELLFDLAFVALVGQLSAALHHELDLGVLALFAGLFACVWWSWVNLTLAVDVSPDLTARRLAAVMLCAMAAVCAIAIAAPDAVGDRAWLFALGNAGLRVLLLALWLRVSWRGGGAARIRVLAYNGATALLWILSIGIPAPARYLLWGVVIVIEIALLVGSSRAWAARVLPAVNIEHLTERFGLLVVIVLGESVLTAVTGLDAELSLPAALSAASGLAVVSLLGWSFFLYSLSAMQDGLDALARRGDISGVRDTVGFLPYFLVLGVTTISGAVSAAVHAPLDPLGPAGVLALCGGIALFYATNAVISLRFGRSPSTVLRWTIPAFALVTGLTVVASMTSALVAIGSAAAALLAIVVLAESPRLRAAGRRPRRSRTS